MARQRGQRCITVDGIEYRWRARYTWAPRRVLNVDPFTARLTVLRSLPGGRAGFIVRLAPDDARASFTDVELGVAVTPALVREAIGFARARGWDPSRVGPFVELTEFAMPGVATQPARVPGW